MLTSMILSLVLSQTNAMAAQSFDVIRNDGSVGTYKLLPVHYDPKQAAIVEARHAFELRDLTIPAIPDEYHIPTELLPPVRDQKQRGTCAYFATVGLLESYYIAQSPAANASINLSEECLVDVRNWMFDQGAAYTGDDKPDQRPDPNGDLPISIIKTISRDGVPATADYGKVDCNYMGAGGGSVSLPDYQALFSDQPNHSFAFGKTLGFDQNNAPTIETIRELIAQNVPVEVGILVYNEYFAGSNWRYDSWNDNNDTLAGGHAVILTGYYIERIGSDEKTIFTFKNSWGWAWGDRGYGTIDDQILIHSWGYDPSFDFITSLHN